MLPVIIGIGLGVSAIIAAVWGANELGLFSTAKGKSIVLMGPKATGKTTWATYLVRGVIPAGYRHTKFTETFEADVPLEKIGLKVSVTDLSGSEAALNDWHKHAAGADRIYYFVAANRLRDAKHLARIEQDARVMALWDDVSAPVTLMITHADLDRQGKSDDFDSIRTRPEVFEIRQRIGASEVVVGDQSHLKGCLDLTVEALHPLTEG